jgi:hypothetical protein
MSDDPLGVLIQQSPIVASIAAVLLLLCCASLVAFWRLRGRLAAIQTQLDGLSRGIRLVEAAQEGLVLRFLNLPRSREPSQLEEKNLNGSALYLVEPKASPE